MPCGVSHLVLINRLAGACESPSICVFTAVFSGEIGRFVSPDSPGQCLCEYGFAGVEYVLNILNYVFGGVFTLEFVLKVFALGPREYAADRLNLFDGFMVLMFAIETSLLGAGVTTNVFKAMHVVLSIPSG